MVTIGQSEYFLSVGWDRRINLYPEIDKKHVIDVRPLGLWDDDVRRGHKGNIISAALVGSNLLATASFDGEILIWNMVSGKVLNRIQKEQIRMSMGQFHFFLKRFISFLDPEVELEEENGPFFTCLARYQEKKKDPRRWPPKRLNFILQSSRPSSDADRCNASSQSSHLSFELDRRRRTFVLWRHEWKHLHPRSLRLFLRAFAHSGLI